jgi:uncharacterized protein (DUF2267 family)
MSLTGLSSLDSSVHLTNAWLKELSEELGWAHDRGRAYHALRAVLHALRDRLPVGEVADLAAQLPLIVRGVYYEGWRPSAAMPVKDHTKAQFLDHVAKAFPEALPADVEDIARAVFKVLSRRIAGGEIDDVRNAMPARLRELWG